MVEILLVVGGAILASALLSQRFHLIRALVLMAVGAAASYLPGMHEVTVPPEVVLSVFLPLLLYWEALTISLRGIRRALRGILLQGTLTVVITALSVGFAGAGLGISLAVGLLIGAAVGPTDATAVAEMGRGIAPRAMVLLRAESLINDGTALVMFALALSYATGSGTISATGALLRFVVSFGGGAIVGLVVGWLVLHVGGLVTDPLAANLLRLLVPFLAYVLAESIQASGVLAVVVAGLYVAQGGPSRVSLGTRVLARSLWPVLTYILNALLFVLAGMEIPRIVAGLRSDSLLHATMLGIVLYVVMVVTRFVFNEILIRSIRLLDRRPSQLLRRTNLPERLVTTTAGFRGAISLAVALSIPDGIVGRDLALYVTAVVVVLSLAVQGTLLPRVVAWSARRPNPVSSKAQAADDDAVRHALRESADILLEPLPSLAEQCGVGATGRETIRRELLSYRLREEHNTLDEEEQRQHKAMQRLRLAINSQARANVIRFRNEGRIDDETLAHLIDKFDVEQLRIQGPLRLE